MRYLSKKAQSTAEYAIVISLVIAAAIAMQVYVRRGIARGLKFSTDNLMDIKGFAKNPFTTTSTGQYEPYYEQREAETTRSQVDSYEQEKGAGEVSRAVGETGTGEKTERKYIQEQRGVDKKD